MAGGACLVSIDANQTLFDAVPGSRSSENEGEMQEMMRDT